MKDLLDNLVDEVAHAVGGQLGLELADDAAAAHLVIEAQRLQRDLDRVVPGAHRSS